MVTKTRLKRKKKINTKGVQKGFSAWAASKTEWQSHTRQSAHRALALSTVVSRNVSVKKLRPGSRGPKKTVPLGCPTLDRLSAQRHVWGIHEEGGPGGEGSKGPMIADREGGWPTCPMGMGGSEKGKGNTEGFPDHPAGLYNLG